MKKIFLCFMAAFVLSSMIVTQISATEIPEHPNFKVIGGEENFRGVYKFFYDDAGKKMGLEKYGEVIIPPIWDQLFFMEEERYNVFGVRKDNLWGLTDRNGNVIIEPKYKEVWVNPDCVRIQDTNDKYGYLDGFGNMLIEPKYDYAQTYFAHGVAEVGRDFGYTYADMNGNEIFPLEPYRKTQSRCGEYFYYTKDGKVYISDKGGSHVSGGVYDDALIFSRDMIFASINSKWGMVNISGDIIIPFEYDSLGDDNETIDCVVGDELVYYDRLGNQLGGRWEYTNNIYTGVVLVIKKDGKYGLMAKDGTIIKEPVYEELSHIKDGYCSVRLSGLVGILKPDGTYLVPPVWDLTGINDIGWVADSSLTPMSDDTYFMVQKNQLYGLLSMTGELIVEPMFDSGMTIYNGRMFAMKGGPLYQIALNENPVAVGDEVLRSKTQNPEAIFLAEEGFLIGEGNGDLRLWDSITRGEFVSILARVDNWELRDEDSDYTDIDNHWAKSAIITASNKGLIKGFGNGMFGPDEYITYKQAFTILLRAMGFSDEYLSNYQNSILSLAYSAKIISTNQWVFEGDLAQRGNIAKFIYAYANTDMTPEKVKDLSVSIQYIG